MGRWRERVRLEDGLKLDINRLIGRGRIEPGSKTFGRVSWPERPFHGQPAVSYLVTAELSDPLRGWIRLQLGAFDQWISLETEPRNFGGRQWYFVCSSTDRRVSILWKPPGAARFLSRQGWGPRVAYASQFETWHDRACSRARAVRHRLGGSEYAGFGDELPPKPKGMHWRTYERKLDQIQANENACNLFLLQCIARL